MKRSQILAAAGAAAALILLVLTLRQVSALRVEVDGPTGIPLGTVDMEPAQSPGQGVSTGSTTQAVNANALWYAADVSEYVQGEDYDLEFRAVLTTAGGLELTDPNPVVTLQQNSGSSGDVDFSPAWEE